MKKVVSDSPGFLPEKKELADDARIQARSLITVYTREEYLHLEALFNAWKDKWWTGSYEMVSDTEKFTEMDEFHALMKQENIVPFIIFKLSDEDNFPAVHLIEDRLDVEYEDVYDQQSRAVALIESYLAGLKRNRSEAKRMSIYEYDEEKHIRQEREEAWEKGKREGQESILKMQISKKLAKGKAIREIAQELEMEESEIQRLIEEF